MDNLISLEYATSQEAWEKVNEYFLLESDEIEKQGSKQGSQLLGYNVFIYIRKAYVDPDFDFGDIFGYRRQKWSSLVNNYVDRNQLDILRSQVHEKIDKKTMNYNISMPFTNYHNSGKNCLLSLTVSRRATDSHPTITVNMRSSEVTKRLLFDLLLVQRIGEHIFGVDSHISIQLFAVNMYQNLEALTMYHRHRNLIKLIKKKGRGLIWDKKLLEILNNFMTVDPSKINYKVHLRSIKRLQKDKDGVPLSGNRPLLASDCKL